MLSCWNAVSLLFRGHSSVFKWASEKLNNITNCKNMDFPWSPQFLLSRSENGHRGSVFIVSHLEGCKYRLLCLVCHRCALSRCRDSTGLPRAWQPPWPQCPGAAHLPAADLCPLCWELWNPTLLQGYTWLDGLGSDSPDCCHHTGDVWVYLEVPSQPEKRRFQGLLLARARKSVCW